MRAWARASADCGSRWPAGGAAAVTADCATTTPPVIASNTAPDNRNKTPYSAVSRSRTLRRASSIRIARLPRLVLAPTGPATGSRPPGCPARPNSEITATVRPMLWPLPYNQVTGSSPDNTKEHEHECDHRGDRLAQAVRAGAGAGRDELHGAARPGDRVHRAQRSRQVHHDAGDPGPGCAGRGNRAGRRAPLREPGAPADPARLAAGRQHAPAQPHRPQP